MTIRKISGATSSIISKAQLVVGTPGIIKASVTRNQLLATVQTEIDIVKSALIAPRKIDHLLYDDEGSSRFLREFVLIGERIGLGQFKTFNDLVVMLDVTDLARLALGAHSYDTVNAAEHTFFAVAKPLVDNFNPVEAISKGIQNAVIDALLPQTDKTTILPGKGINDSLAAQDQNLIFGYGFTYRDAFQAIELKSLGPNKARSDSFTVADARVNVQAGKYFYDTFGMLDLAGVFDGISYNAVMHREDVSAIYEQLAFAITTRRVYADNILIGSLPSLEPQLPKADRVSGSDYSNRQIGKGNLDAFNSTDRLRFDITTKYQDLFNPIDRPFLNLDLLLINRDPARVTATDTSQRQPNKGINDSILAVDTRKYFSISKLLADAFAPISLATVFDGNIFLLDHFTSDVVSMTDLLLRAHAASRKFTDAINNSDTRISTIGKGLSDTPVIVDAGKYFNITKYLADAFTPISLATVFDGNIFLLNHYTNDNQTISDLLLSVHGASRRFADAFNIDDAKALLANKGLTDNQTIVDTKQYLSVTKYLADAFTPISLASVYDGNIFLFNHYVNDNAAITDLLFQLMVGTKRAFSDAFSLTDAKAFLIDKAAADTLTVLERRAFNIAKTTAPDYQDVAEAKYLRLDLSRVDGQTIFDVGTQLYTFKNIFNTAYVAETKTFVIGKGLNDSADAIEYFARKFDVVRGTRDGFVETFLANSQTAITPGKASFDEIFNQDVFSRIQVASRKQEDTTQSQDRIYKLEQRNPANAIVAADLGYTFYIAKGINDPVNMLDLMGTYDGAKYSISMDKTENQPVYEYYRPQWRIRRRGRDGFLEEVIISDAFSINRLQEIDPLANYVYVHGDSGFRYTPSGGQHYYNGINGELFLFLVAPEWTTFNITLGKFEDQPTPDVFKRVVNFVRNPWHNDLIGGGSDGFANYQPMTDVSANSPYPARFFSTNIPSPTKGDTSVTAVVVGGTSSIATNYFMWSNFQTGIRNSIIATDGYIFYYGEDAANPNLGPDGTTSAARITSTGSGIRVSIELTSNATTYGNIFGGTNNGSVTLLNIQPGKEYYFNLKVKSNLGVNINGVRLYADTNGADVGGIVQTGPYTVTNSTWSDLQLAFTPLTSVGIRVSVGGWGSGGSILAASASVSEIATAPYVRTNGWQIGQNPRNIDPAEKVAYVYSMDAKASTSYSVINKTTDFVLGTAKKIINPVLQNSSLTVTYQPKDRDFVGVYDNSPNYVYAAARPTNDFIIPGGDRSLRYQTGENTSETVKFTITKDKFDKDVAGTTGALVTMGRGTSSVAYPERRSGDALDNPAFIVSLDAKQSLLITVSSTTVQARDRDRVFVGQQSWQGNAGGFRNAGDSQERLFYTLSKVADQNGLGSSTAFVVIGSDNGFRYTPSMSNTSETVKFTITKFAKEYDGTTSYAQIGFGDLVERPRIGAITGTGPGGNNFSGESTKFDVTKSRVDSSAGTTGSVVTAGRNSSVASVAYPERRSGDKLDNAAFNFFKTAFAGSSVTWTVQLNTIDPSPDIEYFASSVTLTYGPKDMDMVGTLDRFNLFYTVGRVFDQDFITIGVSSTTSGLRYQPTESGLENTKFFFNKGIGQGGGHPFIASVTGEGTTMLDLAGIFDGLNSYITIFKTDSSAILDVSANSPYPARFMTKNIGVGNHNGTVDIFYIGLSSTATGIRTQPTESSLENTKFTFIKAPGQNGVADTSVVTVGNWQTIGNRTISTSELVTFNVTKLALQGADYSWSFGTTTSQTLGARGDLVYAGDPTFGGGRSRLSGSNFERIGFDFFKTAFAGSSVNWSIQVNTIDPNPDVEYQQSSVTLSYGPKDLDAVGSLDRFFLTLATRRTFDQDFITIGVSSTTSGLRYQPTESSLENTYFTITKSRFDFDVPGTTGAIVTMGRGTSNVAYPERRSGDSLDNPAFIFSLDAKVNSSSTFSYSVSGVTVLGRDRDRLFVGQQSWQGNVLGFRNSGDGQERLFYTLSKVADQNGLGSSTAFVVAGSDNGFRYTPSMSNTSETVKFTIVKAPGQQGAYDTSVVTFGNWQTIGNRTISSSELVSFVVTKANFDRDVAGTTGALVVMGRGTSSVAYPERRSNDKLDTAAFDVSLTAKRSVAGTLLLNTIDPNPDIEYQASSVSVAVNAWDLDAVGTLDRFNLFYQITRTFDQDFVTIGLSSTVTGIRYQPTESSLENTAFFITKNFGRFGGHPFIASITGEGTTMLDLTGIFDGLNSFITIQKQDSYTATDNSANSPYPAKFLIKTTGIGGAGSANTIVTIGGDTGFRYQPTESSLENTKFTFTKAPGRQGAFDTSVVTMGRGWLSVEDGYNFERRSGDKLDNAAFDITKLIKQGVANTWSGYINNSSFTTTAADRGERVYVGDPFQGVYPLRRSGAQAENVGFNFSKTAFAGSSVTWSIKINTIDSDPDFEWRDSSTTLTYGPKDLDAVGIWDRWWMAFGASRSPIDSIIIGADRSLRYQQYENSSETVKFTITKSRFDFDVPGTTGAIVTLTDDLNVAPGRGLFEFTTISDNSRFSPYPAKDFFKTTGIGGAGSLDIATIGYGDLTQRPRTGPRIVGSIVSGEGITFAITKGRVDFDVPGTSGAVVTIGWGDAVERPRTGITYGGFLGDTISGEATTFNITKLADQSVNNTWSGYINNSSFSTTAADNGERIYVGDPFRGVYPLRRSGNQAENVSIQHSLTAKRGSAVSTTLLQFIDNSNGAVSAAPVTYTAPDTDVVGVFGGIVDVRSFIRSFPLYTRDSSGLVIAETNTTEIVAPDERNYKLLTKRVYPDDNPTTSHHLVYTSGDVKTIQFTKSARRGVAGTLIVNTIDPNPDVEYQQSSTALTANSWDADAVGTLDYFSIYYMLYRQFDEYLTIGSGVDSRLGYAAEKASFVFTKLLGQFGDNTTTMLDLTGVYDGNIFTAILSKADTQIIGSGQTSQTFPARMKSGATEIVGFDFYKTTGIGGAGSSNTVATLGRATDGRLGSAVEKAYFTVTATLGNARDTSVQTLAIAGSGVDDRLGYANEKTYFTVSKARFDRDVAGTTGALVVMGRGTNSVAYPERRSGDQLDTAAFLYGLRANRGVTGTVTLKLIDPTDGNGFNSSAAVTYQDWDYDVVGSIDFMSATVFTGRSAFDSILIGSDNGFRYTPSMSNTSETVKFTIGKRANEYDGTTSYAQIGWGDLVERPRIGTLTVDVNNNLYGETTLFAITKFAKEYNGTTANIIMGRGTTSVAYPERRSGDSLDNPAFDFAKTAYYLGGDILREFSSPVPAQTGVTVTAVRSDTPYDPVFVGSQGYAPEADILANSSTTSVWIQQTQQSGYTQGTTYNFSIYMRRPVASGSITFDIGYTSLAVISTTTSFTVTNTWDRYNFNFVAPRSSLTVRIRTTNTTRRDSLAVFGAQIVAGTSPQTYVKTTTAGSASNLLLWSEDFNQAGWTVSSNTIVYSKVDKVNILAASSDWARPGDSMEEMYYTVGKKADSDGQGSSLAFVTMGAGDNYGFRYQQYENSSETVKFTVGKFAKEYNGTTSYVMMGRGVTTAAYPERQQPTESSLENAFFNITMTAKRGVAGSTLVNTIDSNPDIEYRVSSVAVIKGSWEPDDVGTLDAFNLFYQVTRTFDTDTITIGSDTGFRYQQYENSSETVKFLVTKLLGQDDGTTMLDLTNVFDGLVYNTTMIKREALTIGRGTTSVAYPERRSGDSLDTPAFDFFLDAKVGRLSETYTVSGVTVLARDRDRLFVGQQSWQGNAGGFRNAGDRQERISFNTSKVADQDGQGSSTAYVTLGWGEVVERPRTGPTIFGQVVSGEGITFNITKSRFDFDVPGTTGAIVTIGRNNTSQAYPERRSGDGLDNPAFLYGMRANRGVTGTVTLKLIDPANGDGGQSSGTVTYQDYDYDVVGAIDFMFVQMIGTGRQFLDSILIGSDTGFRYQQYENSSETVKFTITKFAKEYDGTTSYAQIGWGDLTERARVGTLTVDVNNNLYGETTKFDIIKTRVDKSAGTTGSVITMGRGTSSVAYPERRSGDSLDNPAFLFSLDAKAGRLSETYTVSGVTVLARDRDRIFVGQQSWQGNTAIRNAGDRQERIFYTVGKFVESDGLGSSLTYVVAGAGDNYGFRYQTGENSSETVKFTITKSKFDFDVPGTTGAIVTMGRGTSSVAYPERRSGDDLDHVVFNYVKTAKRGVAGNVTLNTIDPNPDVEYQQSSVTVSRGDWQLDEVGTLDFFNLYYVINRFTSDTITIGTDTGFRYQQYENSSETVKFTIGKNFGRFGGHPFDASITGEGSTMLDLTNVFDGLIYNSTMLKADTQIMGRGTTSVAYPERRSGDNLDNPAFLFSLDAKAGRLSETYTVSGVTVLARDRDRLFVGQQSWQGNAGGRRNAGDSQERILFTVAKSADQNGLGSSTAFVVAGAGDNYGFRYQQYENSSETVKFTVTKANFDRDVSGTTGAIVTMGRGISSATYPEKRSGQTDEIAQFLFNLDAKQSLLTTVSGTTVQARDRDRVFVGQQNWQGNQGKRVSGDTLESFVINLYKPVTETSTTILDRTALYGQKGGISDDLTMLGDGLQFMNMSFTSPKVDSAEITDFFVINVVFPVNVFDYPGDLDLNGNINTVASYGNLRMTDYADIAYFDDDYVGEKRSFT